MPDQHLPVKGHADAPAGREDRAATPHTPAGHEDRAAAIAASAATDAAEDAQQAPEIGATPRRHTFNEAAHKMPVASTQRVPYIEGEDPREIYDPESADGSGQDVVAHAGRLVLALGALGVVYGDIGTSPLYAEQVTFGFKATEHVTVPGVYGVISLIFWILTIVVGIKYAGVIMRAHNRGDGGIMALAALCTRNKVAHTAILVTLGIFGVSLFFGDGMITPAVSVLSAVSGLEVATPSVAHLVVPISVAILVVLFMIQRKGAGAVGRLFGPVMLLWFTSIAAIGIPHVVGHPGVLEALSPTWAVRMFVDHGFDAFLILGGVVLCVTGAEALYADRGHFGPGPIRMAWFGLVWPAVLLNYMGQAAWIIDHPKANLHAHFNPFFSALPSSLQLPEVVLATMATVIASQAVISGTFTLARQAMQLGYLPRLRVVHTSEIEGQIYVPMVNWVLAAGVITLVLVFRSSDRLANAYGFAVTGTLMLDTVLFLSVARAIWHTARWRLAVLGVMFLTVEVSLFLANVAKLLHGAWLPLVVGIAASVVMLTWRAGQVIVTRNRIAEEGDLTAFLDALADAKPPINRSPGTAVFLNASFTTTPLALRSLVGHTHTLPEIVLIVSLVSRSAPNIPREDRFTIRRLGHGRYPILRVVIHSGYRDTTNIPELLQLARKLGQLPRALDLEGASYFLSRITITESNNHEMAGWRKKVFLTMARNAASPIEQFGLPVERTVQMGSQVAL